MFNDKIEAKDFKKMDKEYQDLLTRVLTIQADCEIGGPHLYVNSWLLKAPSADDMWRVARITSEEIDHYRKMARVLLELDVDVRHLLYKEKKDREVDAFRQAMPTWGDVSVFGFLIDRVGEYQLYEFIDCSYLPLARVLPPYDSTIMDEEKGHVNYGMLKVAELCKTEEGKKEAQEALDRWYPVALDMFGKSESRRSERYLKWGLKRRTNAEARKQYIAEVNPLIEKLGLKLPDEEKGRKFF